MHLRITNHRGHKFPPSLTLLSIKARIEWPPTCRWWPQPQVPVRLFQPLQYSKQRPGFFSAHRGALMTKTDLTFPPFCIRFVDFAVRFCFRCKFSIPRQATLDSSLTVAWFPWTNHNSLLRIAINEFASFCIDNRLRQIAIFVFVKVGKGPAFELCWKIFK